MKIVFLSTYSGIVNRGIESWMYELAQRLSENNDVTIFQFGQASGQERYKVERVDIKVDLDNHDLSHMNRLLILNYWSRMLARFTLKIVLQIKKIRPDIIIPLNGGWQTIT